jgi:zinc transport system substrate-binding protein
MNARLSVLLFILGILTASCAPKESSSTAGAPAASADKIGVVEVSNYPLEYVVTRLGDPLLEVRFRAADASDPAYWKPTPEDVLAMQEADLIVVNGATYESWMKDVSLPASRVVDTTAAAADRLLPLEEHVTHSHGPEGAHEHSGTAFTTWLDPTLLTAQAEAAAQALSTRWPDHAELFARRLAELTSDLEALDADLTAAIRPFEGKRGVFSHPVYQYLQARYGINGKSLHLEPGVTPDPDQLAELERVIASEGAGWMIWEGEPAPGLRERLATIGVTLIVFEPLGTRPATGDYLDVMHRNLEALQRSI